MAQLTDISGIDDTTAEKLKDAGISSVHDLQDLTGDIEGTKVLAEKTGFTEEQVMEWVRGSLIEELNKDFVEDTFQRVVGFLKYQFRIEFDFQFLLVVLIILTAFLETQTGAIAGRAGNFSERREMSAVKAGIRAGAVQTRIHSTAYDHLASYVEYKINNTLIELNEAEIADASPEEAEKLLEKIVEAEQLAANSRAFFPAKYIDPDGTYNLQRELGELWSEEVRVTDVDPEPYLEQAEFFGRKAQLLSPLSILGAGSLFLFAFTAALHDDRKFLKRAIVYIGVGVMLVYVLLLLGVLYVYGY